MITELKIKNLFGQFNYALAFKGTGINIITGPNGFGKSTILKIIESIVEKDLYELCQFPFEYLEVTTTNYSLKIEKLGENIIVNDCVLKLFSPRIMDNWHRRRGASLFEQIGPDTVVDLRHDRILSYDEYLTLTHKNVEEDLISDKLIYLNYEQAKAAKKERTLYKNLQKYIDLFRQDVGKIKFIKEQRLIRQETERERYYSSENKTKVIEVITELPFKMKAQIKDVVLKYSETSSKLDNSFPSRLFEAEKTITQDEYLHALGNIILQQEKMQDYNLIKDLHLVSISGFKQEHSKALKVYIDDTIEKIAVYNNLIKKLDIFVKTINSKLYNKKIKVSSEFGLKVVENNGDEKELELNKLSSGEQQIIVLYYELIFEMTDKMVLLIDEPEISLHVAWQRTLMEDLNKIIGLKEDSLSVIVATHSPQVINNNWNDIIDLGEQNARV